MKEKKAEAVSFAVIIALISFALIQSIKPQGIKKDLVEEILQGLYLFDKRL